MFYNTEHDLNTCNKIKRLFRRIEGIADFDDHASQVWRNSKAIYTAAVLSFQTPLNLWRTLNKIKGRASPFEVQVLSISAHTIGFGHSANQTTQL